LSSSRNSGFVDLHTHLLRVAAKCAPAWRTRDGIADYHRRIAEAGSSPMDQPPEPVGVDDLPTALHKGLQEAADLGLVEVWEAGMSDPTHLDALLALRDLGPLPLRVRVLVASGLAEQAMPSRTDDDWIDVAGVKFYADGWLGPRTCALCRPFADRPGDDGILFQDADRLASRMTPLAEAGWTIATHAIGDRAIETVLDAYDRVYGDDCRTAAPRIEHAQVLRPDLIARMAEMGTVACIQPCFAASDANDLEHGLGREWPSAYRWQELLDAGVRVVTGSDYPIEPLSPQHGLEQLTAIVGYDTALALMTDATGTAAR
jgi:predicted amidohydrolase YtcJ